MKIVENLEKSTKLKGYLTPSFQKRWQRFAFIEQMANVGMEVFRTIKAKSKQDEKSAELAFKRAMELFDLTLQDPKNEKKFGEVVRARESFVDFFKHGIQCGQSAESINNYFYNFNYLARIGV
ncbi:MAG: hypothetical protein ABH810_03500 [bacterium]